MLIYLSGTFGLWIFYTEQGVGLNGFKRSLSPLQFFEFQLQDLLTLLLDQRNGSGIGFTVTLCGVFTCIRLLV